MYRVMEPETRRTRSRVDVAQALETTTEVGHPRPCSRSSRQRFLASARQVLRREVAIVNTAVSYDLRSRLGQTSCFRRGDVGLAPRLVCGLRHGRLQLAHADGRSWCTRRRSEPAVDRTAACAPPRRSGVPLIRSTRDVGLGTSAACRHSRPGTRALRSDRSVTAARSSLRYVPCHAPSRRAVPAAAWTPYRRAFTARRSGDTSRWSGLEAQHGRHGSGGARIREARASGAGWRAR